MHPEPPPVNDLDPRLTRQRAALQEGSPEVGFGWQVQSTMKSPTLGRDRCRPLYNPTTNPPHELSAVEQQESSRASDTPA